MVKALLDTNILIDYLNTVPQALGEVDGQDDLAISAITWIEVMVGTSASNETATRRFLSRFAVVTLDQDVSEQAAVLRHVHRLKLADAIAWASARVTRRLFVTRDVKDFSRGDPGIRIPYTL